ncbi:hypothetical protein EJ05DRAFT_472453 [Pseudovirgaria hyperparasitica]|uniref:Uncharacterized protein n=1 Tax=Pseudovirgaria hyperparasitica TaxID=470096 RepID=A0A6A6WN68_9PEZI|nr:uncharacterized protein EJ05DRAFT_472453 [Pseudovirgaria hyperparasitica]KAF2763558.1 hypothetical protein EJ05DRAFT_472453 [Pseudovirgaria hyperparasitica]
MLALLPMDSTDKATTGTVEMMMGVETNALVRVAEDTLQLTRQLQELWLFGTLDTLGKSEVELKTEEDAKAVAEGIEKLVKSENIVQRSDGETR